MQCTLLKDIEIVPGKRKDYEELSRYHYRAERLGPYAGIYIARTGTDLNTRHGLTQTIDAKTRTHADDNTDVHRVCGVIVYSMPTAGAQMRNAATGGLFIGMDRITQIKLINKNFRTISRVIIEPRFRSIGLAAMLVSQTMPLINVPFIEALAVMGLANPFFEKAGMTRYDAPVSLSSLRLIEAFGSIGIDEDDLIDAEVVLQKLVILTAEHAESAEKKRGDKICFIEDEIKRFIKSYGRRRNMEAGIERTRFILSKLAYRPVYYLWRNKDVELDA